MPTKRKDVLKTRAQARLRKQRQRERLRKTHVELSVALPVETSKQLEILGLLAGGKTKEQIVADAIEAHYAEKGAAMAPVIRMATLMWPKIRALLPYSTFLTKRGTVHTVAGRQLKADDWLDLQPAWGQLVNTARHLGIKSPPAFYDQLLETCEPTKP